MDGGALLVAGGFAGVVAVGVWLVDRANRRAERALVRTLTDLAGQLERRMLAEFAEYERRAARSVAERQAEMRPASVPPPRLAQLCGGGEADVIPFPLHLVGQRAGK